MGGNERTELSDLVEAMKRATEVLRHSGIPFAVCGGLAVYARGGTPTNHDVDVLIREEDVEPALAALAEAGFRIERPPLDWLVKAYDGDVLIDFIFRPVDRPVTEETLAQVDHLSIGAARVPVLSATELLIHGLRTLTAQECDLATPLLLLRAIREQIDLDRVRTETKDSPFAQAFLFLAEQLEVIP
jgi:Uncharacterised nucleotidyltransferase